CALPIFERSTRGIGLALVVARGDPDLAIGLDPYLRRAQYMPGRMQRHACPAEGEGLAVIVRVHHLPAQAPAQDRNAVATAVVLAHAAAGVVAMAMGDDRARHRPPRIDVEIAGRAVKPFRAQDDQVVGGLGHGPSLGRRACRRREPPARRGSVIQYPWPQASSSPMSSFHTCGLAAIQSPSMRMHSASLRSMTSTPCSRSHSCPPWKLTASPITTVPMPNCLSRPLQFEQGESVGTVRVWREDRWRPA